MPKKSRVPGWTMTRSLAEMDVVYTLGPNSKNEELRYSLRSIVKNMPHRQVWLVGYPPPWLANCKVLAESSGATKEARIYNSVLAAARHPELSDQFILFNDDFYVTAPITRLPSRYLKSLRAHTEEPNIKDGSGGWRDSLIATAALLDSLGIKTPVSYELHIPMVFDKKILAEVMEPYVSDLPPQLRSLYGNLARIGGERYRDVKAVKTGMNYTIPTPFFSTHPPTFLEYQPRLQAMFPDPTPHEQVGTARLVLAAAIMRKLAERQGAG